MPRGAPRLAGLSRLARTSGTDSGKFYLIASRYLHFEPQNVGMSAYRRLLNVNANSISIAPASQDFGEFPAPSSTQRYVGRARQHVCRMLRRINNLHVSGPGSSA